MFKGKKVVVVMPAYNAEKTLKQTYDEVMAQGMVDTVVVVDDASSDETAKLAKSLPNTRVHVHEKNSGYGANQKSCYRIALEEGADIVVMVHPDYQYTPLLIPSMVNLIASDLYHCVLASRIIGGHALKGGMPWWRYIANRCLTLYGNIFMGSKLSEFHTGYRAFSKELLEKLDLEPNSDDFVFDNQMLAQVLWHNYLIGEVSCPTKYFDDASSINFRRSCIYGFGCLWTATLFRFNRLRLNRSKLFPRS
ncbi:MAG: glycosyltransferase family 2 protein [Planctomycetota bacterium]|nr:glycosyltransferase family 2 protein [Planctomycetota bacterium]